MFPLVGVYCICIKRLYILRVHTDMYKGRCCCTALGYGLAGCFEQLREAM